MADELAPMEQEESGASLDSVSAVLKGQTEEAPSFFHTYTNGKDGSVHNFKNADELNAWINDHYFKTSDYTRKTQKLSDKERAFNERVKMRESELDKLQGQFKEWDDRIKNNPKLFRQLEKELSKGNEVNPEIEAIKRELAENRRKEYEAKEAERLSGIRRASAEKYGVDHDEYTNWYNKLREDIAPENYTQFTHDLMAELYSLKNKPKSPSPALGLIKPVGNKRDAAPPPSSLDEVAERMKRGIK